MTAEHPEITEELVRRLVAEQFSEYADLPVRRVEPGGNDNRTFRLGEELSVRLPTAHGYVAAVEKEQTWLTRIAASVPVPIPEPIRAGRPGARFPCPWSIIRWIDGEDALTAPASPELARDIGKFIVALQATDAAGGPLAGAHSFFHGASLAHYDDEAREAIGRRAPDALSIWERVRQSQWSHEPVWFHCDIAPGNILIRDGRLAAVIDFGTCGVGDPACDLAIAWTYFTPHERRMLAAEVAHDADTWARARGWALWKAAITDGTDADRVIEEVLADPVV